LRNKIHPHMALEYSIDSFNCRWSHGWGKLECQCKKEFAHDGECECYDKRCNQTWSRPTL